MRIVKDKPKAQFITHKQKSKKAREKKSVRPMRFREDRNRKKKNRD